MTRFLAAVTVALLLIVLISSAGDGSESMSSLRYAVAPDKAEYAAYQAARDAHAAEMERMRLDARAERAAQFWSTMRLIVWVFAGVVGAGFVAAGLFFSGSGGPRRDVYDYTPRPVAMPAPPPQIVQVHHHHYHAARRQDEVWLLEDSEHGA